MMDRILHSRRKRLDGVTFAAVVVIGCLLYIASLVLEEEPYTDSIDFAPASHRWLRSEADNSNDQPILIGSVSTENTDLQSPVNEPASKSIVATEEETWAVHNFFKTQDTAVKTQDTDQKITANHANLPCYPTTSFRATPAKKNRSWVLQSFVGTSRKSVGGDEFYMTLLRKNDSAVLAVGHATDLQDGRYDVKFQLSQIGGHVPTGDYTTMNVLQYSCSEGFLPPPLKAGWDNGHFVNLPVEVDTRNIISPPPIMPMDTSEPLDLTRYRKIVAFGDSLMEQFVKGRTNNSPPLIYTKVQRPLSTDTLDSKFLLPLRNICQREKCDNTTLVLLNSGVWDLLEDGSCRGPPYFSNSCCHNDSYFKDHETAMETMITTLEHELPGVTLGWNSMTAVHVHRIIDCSTLNCINRTKYMSTSRASQLYNMQVNAMSRNHPNVQVIKLYDLTYNRAHFAQPNDGRHYICGGAINVCREIWNAAFQDGSNKFSLIA